MNATLSPSQPESVDHCSCEHCGLPVPAALINDQTSEQFCCSGCRTAYEVIKGCGLDEYYRLREISDEGGQASAGSGDNYTAFDSPAFLRSHATSTANGLLSIELRLEGVHCSACVWLVERLPLLIDGVVEARLSLGSCSAKIVWDNEATSLARIAETLDRLGYGVHPAQGVTARDARLATERKQLTRVAVAGALAGNNMLIALALYAGVFDSMAAAHEVLFRWTSMVLGLVSLAWPGMIFFRSAAASLRAGVSSLDQPIALALGAGALAGTANVLLSRGDVYFDSLSVLVFLLLVGRFLQARQQRWASDAVGMAVALTPSSCRVVRGSRIVTEPIEALQIGDVVEVRSGDTFPADGAVLSGQSSVDLSLLTGESAPIPVGAGDEVYSGATNYGGVLRIDVTAVGGQTRISKLQELIHQGLEARTPLVCFADRIGRWFVVAVGIVASVNAIAWLCVSGVEAAIDTTVAVLIVACPCALGLATPLTMALAIGQASRSGMLIKSADVFERLSGVTPGSPGRMLLDKTGTLTHGELKVVNWLGERQLLDLVASAERGSSHPVARALVAYADANRPTRQATSFLDPIDGTAGCETQSIEEVHGCGLRCHIHGRLLIVGTPEWVQAQTAGDNDELAASVEQGHELGCTCVTVAVDNELSGVAWLSDRPYDDSNRSLQSLRAAGWQLEILSGDHTEAVRRLATEIGVAPDMSCSRLTPEEKLDRVRLAVSQADSSADQSCVVMVGDGVNDAAALATAHVGVAVQGGAEAALSASDVYLTQPGIGQIENLLRLARRTVHTAHRNLLLSLAYNVIAVTLATAGWVTPLVAALLMPLSSAAVLLSAISGITATFASSRQRR